MQVAAADFEAVCAGGILGHLEHYLRGLVEADARDPGSRSLSMRLGQASLLGKQLRPELLDSIEQSVLIAETHLAAEDSHMPDTTAASASQRYYRIEASD